MIGSPNCINFRPYKSTDTGAWAMYFIAVALCDTE